MRIHCNCYQTFPNDSSKYRKRIETGRQLWLTFKEISVYRRSWVLSFTSSSYFKNEYCQSNYFISPHCSLSFWKGWQMQGQNGLQRDDLVQRPLPVLVSSQWGCHKALCFSIFLPQFLFLTHSLQHIKIGEKEKETDSEEEAKISHFFDQF